MKKKLIIQLPEAIGDTIAAGGTLRYLSRNFSSFEILIRTKYPDLVSDIQHPFQMMTAYENRSSAINLSDYLLLTPHSRNDRKHHVFSMIEVLRNQVQEKFNIDFPEPAGDEWPVIIPDENEQTEAQKFLERNSLTSQPLPLVWIAPKSTSRNRHWPNRNWLELEEQMHGQCHFIEFLGPGQTRVMRNSFVNRSWIRTKAAIMQLCCAGITVDTYAIHLASALGLTRVIAVLGSSHPDCVLYPGMKAIFAKSLKTQQCQPCGNHGYDPDIGRKLGLKFRANGCIYPDFPCMKHVTVGEVSSNLRSVIR